ncbi:hypothetical protein [Marinicellulosiphila megalodicopiae]|uniref:hypothetical protein n=1 Tax=Marinicellulosiphila megalodicopiae TaxID=2724896 RepID=UPI003BB157C6
MRFYLILVSVIILLMVFLLKIDLNKSIVDHKVNNETEGVVKSYTKNELSIENNSDGYEEYFDVKEKEKEKEKENENEKEVCVIDKGVIKTVKCEEYKYLLNMGLSEYSNLRIHIDIGLMVENGSNIIKRHKGFIVYELGISDQGPIYYFVDFDGGDESQEGYFLNSNKPKWSFSFLSQDVVIDNEGGRYLDIRILNKLEFKFDKLNLEPELCLDTLEFEMFSESDLDLKDFENCSKYINGYHNVNLIEVHDKNLRECIFGRVYRSNYYVDPNKVEILKCGSIKGIGIDEVSEFGNVKSIIIGSNDSDHTFLNELKNLREIEIKNNTIFNMSNISELIYLESLIVSKGTLINSDEYSKGISQLKRLSLKRVKVGGELVFLKSQFSLKKLELIGMELDEFPEVGSVEYIEFLNIKKNSIVEIPLIKKMMYLKYLNLEFNQFTKIPSIDENWEGELKLLGNPIDCTYQVNRYFSEYSNCK